MTMPSSDQIPSLPARLSRRSLLRDGLAAGAALALLAAGVRLVPRLWAADHDRLTSTQWADLEALQALILPSEPGIVGARELGATNYVRLALADPRLDPEDVDSLLSVLKQLDKLAAERHRVAFASLPAAQQAALVPVLLDDAELVDPFGVVVVLTLEAALSDPVYGGNCDGAGWTWLGIAPPLPRPPEPWFQGAV